jgi:hypothetical protein
MITDATLDSARTRGDQYADDIVAAIFRERDRAGVVTLVTALMRDDQAPGALPEAAAAYLAKPVLMAKRESASVESGERVFAEHGPEIMMLLCCYSLPSSYAARKGVQVLHRTAYLAKRPNRRLFETAQMIVDVMSPGGLGPRGKGLKTAQKVRLMHAAIRHLILRDPSASWDTAALGVPINQEDLLGTLMTFTWIILDGLSRIGVKLTPEEQQAYLDTWLSVGLIMGIEPPLLPKTVAEARRVTELIERRQVAESAEGREMMTALLGMMQHNLPHAFRTVPGCLIREFLPADVATFLGVPSHPLEQEVIRLAQTALRPLERFIDLQKKRHAFMRVFSIHLLQWMISVEMDGRPAQFAIPDSLQEDWQIAPAESEDSFWKKLHDRFHRP